jgi:hypothetical protein
VVLIFGFWFSAGFIGSSNPEVLFIAQGLTLPQLKKIHRKGKKGIVTRKSKIGLAYIMKHSERWLDCVIHNRKIYKSVLE